MLLRLECEPSFLWNVYVKKSRKVAQKVQICGQIASAGPSLVVEMVLMCFIRRLAQVWAAKMQSALPVELRGRLPPTGLEPETCLSYLYAAQVRARVKVPDQ